MKNVDTNSQFPFYPLSFCEKLINVETCLSNKGLSLMLWTNALPFVEVYQDPTQ